MFIDHLEMSLAKPQRLVIVLHPDIPTWQSLNITAFLASGLASIRNNLLGSPYVDGSGVTHTRLFSQPVVVLQANTAHLQSLIVKARATDEIGSSVFVRGMLLTDSDADNRATISNVPTAQLDLLGIGLVGPKNKLNKLLAGVPKHI